MHFIFHGMWLISLGENNTYPAQWCCLHWAICSRWWKLPMKIQAMCSGLKRPSQLTFSKVATALDPRFKDLKCLPRPEREEVWRLIKEESPQQPKKTARTTQKEEEPPVGCIRFRRWREGQHLHGRLSIEMVVRTCRGLHKLGTSRTEILSYHCNASTLLLSLSGHIVQKKRAALSSDDVNRWVCLSNWLKENK